MFITIDQQDRIKERVQKRLDEAYKDHYPWNAPKISNFMVRAVLEEFASLVRPEE